MRLARIVSGAALCAALMMAHIPAFAQGAGTQRSQQLTATIIGPADIAAGRTVILDASASRIVGNNIQYFWYVNGGQAPISTTVDAIYTPDSVGEIRFRLVVRAVVNGEQREDEEEHVVTVYRRKVLLVADANVPQREIERLQAAAASGSTYLRVLRSSFSAVDRQGEDALTALLTQHGSALQDAETVILWIDGLPTPGVHALLQVTQGDLKLKNDMQNQTLLLPTVLRLQTVARTVKGPLDALVPERAFVLRPSLLPLLFSSRNDDAFLQNARGIPSDDLQILDVSAVRIPGWYLLTRLVNVMLGLGVSTQTILLLLALPVIAMILAIMRQVVGISTFGLFTPAIITLSFLVLGWVIGVLFLLFILMTGYASRTLLKRLPILYIPKLAIILGIGAITLLLLVAIGTSFGVLLSHDTVFVLLIMSTLVESFLNVKSEQGMRSALLAVGQTIVAALFCILIIQWASFRALLLAYPEIILLTFLVNIVIGRFTGLRITEYFRFREVFKALEGQE